MNNDNINLPNSTTNNNKYFKGVVILTYTGSPFKQLAEQSIKVLEKEHIPYIIAENKKENSEYEMLAIKEGMKHFKKEFIVLQDSCLLKNADIIKQMFVIQGAVFLNIGGLNYFNKYEIETLSKMEIPVVKSKLDAVKYESEFHSKYKEIEKPTIIPILNDTNVFEECFGRNNMIIENQYFKKYKGHWNLEMCNE